MGAKLDVSQSPAAREAVAALLRLTSRLCGRPAELLLQTDGAPAHGVDWIAEDGEFRAVASVRVAGATVAVLSLGGQGAPDEGVAEILIDAAAALSQALGPRGDSDGDPGDPIPAQLRYLIDSAPVAMALHDRDLRFLIVNERWRFDFADFADGDVIGRSLYDVEPSTRALEPHYRNCMAGERLLGPRYPVKLRDGRVILVSSTTIPWRTTTGEVGGVLSMFRVLDEGSADRFELVRTEQRLETAIRLANILVWEMDYAQKSMWARAPDETLLDFEKVEASSGFLDVQRDPFGTVLPEDRALCEEEAERALAESRPFRAEYRLNRTDQEVWVASAMETQMSDGQPETTLGVMIDITQRKKAERELERALAAAEAANHAKSEFLANMSHEIRTPMNGVIGMNSLLLKTPLTPEQRKYAEAVRVSADSLMHILNDILEVSKLEAGKVELESVDFSLLNLVEDALELMGPRAQEKGLDLGAYVDVGARGLFRGDPTRVRQVLLNLLSNAVKFTELGHVCVDVGASPLPDGRVAVRLQVRDTGIGLSTEAKAKLFQKFQQADGSITRRYGGTGLGLSICRQLMDLMEGRIGVEDAPEGGAVFWIELDLVQAGKHPKVCRSDLRNARVLVVDGSALNRTIFRRQLECCGAIVAEADSAEACFTLLGAAEQTGEPFAAVLVDQMLPETSGEAVVRSLRAREGKAPALVMASSMGEPMTAQRAAEIGLDAYLTKPVRHQALIATLGQALGGAPVEDDSAPDVADVVTIGDGGARVLLAEDNEINTLLARTILEQVGFSVTCVNNGVEAVAAFLAEPFDLVLMDVQMPVMDGLQATRRIRAVGGAASGVPIVAMTANAMRSDRDACLEAGMDDFISKPIDAAAFLALLERVMVEGPDERTGGSRSAA
jgi:signal transduction histidine kinase/DNA-binding response OmpR family regulator